MDETSGHFTLFGKSPVIQLVYSLLIIIIPGILLLIVFIAAGAMISGEDFASFFNNYPDQTGGKSILILRYLLITQDISLFIVPAIIIFYLMEPDHQINIMLLRPPEIIKIVLVTILAFCIFPITSFTGQLNSLIHLPEWLSGIEYWMRVKEDDATRITDLLMVSETFWIMILNLLMIAVIPAIGEEFIFRGVFQKILSKLFNSGHLAIWVTAIMFSAIHFQFFGFVPRLILGLVFGYLFFWSGSLWLPVISHFINNAVPVIGAYLAGWEKINNTTDVSIFRQIILLPAPVLVSIVILLYFRNRSSNKALQSTV